MKVFQIHSIQNGREITQYATHPDNNLLAVTEYFTRECDAIGDDLKGVTEILVITNNCGRPM